jgi:hypothetical protein
MMCNHNSVKRIVISILLLMIIVYGAAYANEVSAVWARLYGRARSMQQQYDIMLNIVELDDRDMIPTLSSALEELLLNQRNLGSTTEKALHTRLTKLIVMELGTLKALETADYVWDVQQTADDPILKGEAIIALGKMGAKEYADEIAMILRNLNLNLDPGENVRFDETIAYACVMALGRMKELVGYESVFFAARGWYSSLSRVKEKAKSVLVTMVDDPTSELLDILTSYSEFDIKLDALRTSYDSKAPAGNKLEVAKAALRDGLIHEGKNRVEETYLTRMRLLSASMFMEFGLQDPAAVPLLEEMVLDNYRANKGIDEILTALQALGTSRDDAAAGVLSNFLKLQNERQSSGLTTGDYRVVKTTIQALGNTENPIGTEELFMVEHSNWVGSVTREAKAAMEKIKNASN